MGYKPAYMAFLHIWRREARKSGGMGSHARASLYYMVEHWERHLYTMEVVRNRETHTGRSAAVKMIMAS